MERRQKKAHADVHKRLPKPRVCQGCGKHLKQKYRKWCGDCRKKKKKEGLEEKKLERKIRACLKRKYPILEKLFKQNI